VHVSFCSVGAHSKNVNRSFCGLSVKLGGLKGYRQDFHSPGAVVMDDKTQNLKEKLERLFREAADVAVELQSAEGGMGKPVHFSQIEAAAHAVGSRLSCRIQERAAREVAASSPAATACPKCGASCHLKVVGRTINSTDGAIEISEPKGYCTRCRRAFFPSA
jgi:hypothetical protein